MKKLLLIFVFLLTASAAHAQSQPPITIREVDGSPKVTQPTEIVVPNDSLTVSGRKATLTFSGGAGSGTVTNTGTLTAGKVTIGNGTTDVKVSKVTLTDPATAATITILNNKTFTVNNTLTFAGTDGSTLNVGAGGTLGSNAFSSTAYVPTSTTVNSKALSGNIVLGLASSDFANQGTTTTILHGNASGNPAFGQVVNADVSSSAAIVDTKLATISTAGKVADTALSANVPRLNVANIFTANNEIRRDGIGSASTPGLLLNNSTVTDGDVLEQRSPALNLRGHIWDSFAGADNIYDALGQIVSPGVLSWSVASDKLGDTVGTATLNTAGTLATTKFQTPNGSAFTDNSIELKVHGAGQGDVFGANSTKQFINYYGTYFEVQKQLTPILTIEGGAVTDETFYLRGPSLTSGILIHGEVPATGFTGDLIKITDNAGTPVTKFRVTSSGVIVTGTGPTTWNDSAGKILSAALNTVAVANGGTGITSFGTGVATWLGTPSSANLLAVTTDETGSGLVMGNNTPTIITPSFTTGFTIAGAATSRKIIVGNGTNFVASTETYAVPGTSGNVMTSDGTNWTSAAPSGGSGITIGSTTITSGTSTRLLFDLSGAVSEDADLTFATDTLTATKVVAPTSVSTPSIITASGALTLTPASNANVVFNTSGQLVLGSVGLRFASGNGLEVTDAGGGLNFIVGQGFGAETAQGSAFVVKAWNNSGIGTIRLQSAGLFNFSSTTDTNGTPDSGLARNAAGVVEINNGTAGTFRDLITRNIKLGATTSRGTTEGTNTLSIFNGTAPVGTLTNGASFYAASGEMNVIDAGGNVTLLSPHDLLTNEWIFLSCQTTTGRCIKVNMERLVHVVEQLSGTKLLQEWIQ